MRLFTAIDLPAATKAVLAAHLDRLRPLARLRWSPVDNLHITTKFIGEWPEAQLDVLKRALATVPPQPVAIAVRGLGWFPNADRPARLMGRNRRRPAVAKPGARHGAGGCETRV
jgi:2'-5' RNA ligase